MIVVDTNIISYLYLTSDRSVQAEQALIRDSQWVAPLLWRSEFRSVLALYIRRGLLVIDDALEVMNEAVGLMQGREYDVDSRRVLSLVASSACSAYDCEFVALAEDLGVPLITVDKGILSQFPRIAISLDSFVAPPR